jgi:hypothetical protein
VLGAPCCNQKGLEASAPSTVLRVIDDMHILQDVKRAEVIL